MTRYVSFVIILGIVILAGIWGGCTGREFTITSATSNITASPTEYLPLTRGLRVDYTVTIPQPQHFDIEVADPVTVDNYAGFTIRRTDRDLNQTTISYRYVKGNAIFETQSLDYPGARILEAPFEVGRSWNRFDTSTTTLTVDTTGSWIDTGNIVKSGSIDPGGFNKEIPGQAYGTMTIVGFETVRGSNGQSYGHCMKVEWQTGADTKNYYWYYAGVGMVKFAEGVSTLSSSEAQLEGVVANFQIVKY